MVVFLFLKEHNLSVTLCQHCQGRCLYPSHIQGFMVEDRKKTGGVNTDQPVRLRTAQGRMVQRFIAAARLQVGKALPDSRILHRGNPEPPDRFCAAGHFHRQTEDQFSLTPGVTAVHQLRHVRALHQGLYDGKLLFLSGGYHMLPDFRQDRQVLIVPFLIAFLIGSGLCKGYQVPDTPGHQTTVPLQVSVFLILCTQGSGISRRYTGFFSDNQFHTLSSSFGVSSRYSTSVSSYSSSKSYSPRSSFPLVEDLSFMNLK